MEEFVPHVQKFEIGFETLAFCNQMQYASLLTGCGSVWLERSVRDAETARSNRAIPTRNFKGLPIHISNPFFFS